MMRWMDSCACAVYCRLRPCAHFVNKVRRAAISDLSGKYCEVIVFIKWSHATGQGAAMIRHQRCQLLRETFLKDLKLFCIQMKRDWIFLLKRLAVLYAFYTILCMCVICHSARIVSTAYNSYILKERFSFWNHLYDVDIGSVDFKKNST